ncbi:hypothetical protein ACJ73_05977 [Blastomyces percursus]|uniref:Uncharacterized protein n=1 Tax=Blastomyces percursus TaxID=1658174 RepID=A0A1J9Q2B9_9EURO|nr:hypothetical protein ACJ73_05977 [Blastomyces percursus]
MNTMVLKKIGSQTQEQVQISLSSVQPKRAKDKLTSQEITSPESLAS